MKIKLFVILLLLSGIVSAIDIPWDKTCYTDSGECSNKETNLKRVIHHKISISSPQEIVCDWRDPNSNWKDCKVVLEIENSQDTDFPLPINPLRHRFKHSIKEMRVSYSKDYTNYAEEILNITCYEDLSEEEKRDFDILDKSRCYYNITKKSFYNWEEVNGLGKIPANSVIGVGLNFKSPILVKDGKYLRNQFNFTLQGLDREITLDPVISGCAILSSSGETYTLTADIFTSTSCMLITANNVILDCQGHLIQGNFLANQGIEITRSDPQLTNVTVKNCIITRFRNSQIWVVYSSGNTFSNITANDGGLVSEGIYLIYSNLNILSNIEASNNQYYGISTLKSDSNNFSNLIANNNIYGGIEIGYQSNSNTFSNITTNFNPNDGIEIWASNSNTFSNTTTNFNGEFGFKLYGSCGLNTIRDSKIQNNAYGGIRLDLYGPYTPIGLNNIYNNLLNNTDNVYISGNTTNYWNTTKQPETNIIGGPYIGGNYWTNPSGTGYSDICTDTDKDGFCDNPYELNSKNIDYLPLSDEYQPPSLPDLTLTQDDISFSPETPEEGETVTITATIHNIGNTNAENVLVRFYDENPSTGTQINGDQTTATIPAGENGTASVEWTATLGSHEIYVVVDPEDMISEEDEENNVASKEIVVATYKVLVVATYYKDESLNDIKQYESRLNERLEDTTGYYLEQSYGHDYIWFSEPVYVQMPHSSLWYLKIPTFPSDYFVPSAGYADDVCDLVDENGYDAILTYQTDKGVETGHKKGFRAVTYKPPFPPICRPVVAVSINDRYGTFAHELGHALYNFDDFYGDWTQGNRGNIGYWGLMGMGDLSDPPAPIISFNKEIADWLDYDTTWSSELTEPKTFQLKALEDMSYGDDVVELHGIGDDLVSFYNFIIEAREKTPSSPREPGVVIYQDHHGLLGSFLENLPPQNTTLSGPESIPTLYVYKAPYEYDSEYYCYYRHIPTGLKFQYIGDTNPGPNSYEPEVEVGYNVSENANITGVIINNLDVYSNSSNLTSGSFAPPPCATPVTVIGFSKIRPIGDSIRIVADGRFHVSLINAADKNVRINSIKIVNSVNQTECVINSTLPINVSAGESFTIIGEECGVFDDKSIYPVQLSVEISYDTFPPDKTVLKHIDIGIIRFIPSCMQEQNGFHILLIYLIFGIPFLFMVLIGLISIIKYRKNKKTVILWFIALIALLLAFIFLYSLGQFTSAATFDSDHDFGVSYTPPVNLTYPDIDLHAYTDTGLHIGMNYETGTYENQIPGAVSSGDLIAEEWIFVPNNLNVRFVVDSHDVQQYLSEINSNETLITNYSVQVMEYGESPSVVIVEGNVTITDRRIYKPIHGTIGPNETNTVFLPATIDIDPDTLNLKSKGKWITAYIELPEGYDVSEIEINTVMLNFTVPAENNTKYGFVKNPEIKDRNNNGLLELMVKFDRPSVQEMLAETSGMVKLVVTGEVIDDDIPILFKGMDSIKIHTKGKKKE